ncbi:hypothetical protein BDEG_26191 [Batrachochytrium dendrobatidis JEL423]|uniref:Cation-transporting P-type ATPase N-terminal domain-containing protein n=3 Tax=Batrachochytrium dendrobatidis TaxID=109871 RepID=A0A177WRN6_BATDL|nr:hypothetical protein BDEG_26191 [Batrachochytrium dendrobatidis JEL423]
MLMGNSATAWFGSSITTAYIFTVLVCDLLGSGFMHVEAKPLHAVNQFDLNGNVCPLPLRYSQLCPVLCVKDIALCPALVQPAACPSGQFYCQDGQCHAGNSLSAACPASMASVCSCGSDAFASVISPVQSSGSTLFPCSPTQPRVNVKVWSNSSATMDENPAGDTDLALACATALGLDTGSIPANITTPFFKQCLLTAKVLAMNEPEFVIFFGFIVVQSIILVLFQIYRSVRSTSSHISTSGSSKQTTVFESGLEMESVIPSFKSTAKLAPSNIKFSGYRHDPLGTLVLATVVISSFVWLGIMSIIIGDYYQVFSGYSYRGTQMIFGDHDNLSRIFIVLWHIMTIWYVTLQINSAWLQTYFKTRAPLTRATHVLVEKEIPCAVQFSDAGKWVLLMQRFEKTLQRMTKTDRAIKLTRVKYTTNGRKYIEFECVRYVMDSATGSFEPYSFNIGPKCSDLVFGKEQANGLPSTEAERRVELCGPNEIVFKIDTFARGLIKEFTGIFYIYQLMMLLIWYYYAYYYMGIVLTIVIIASGIVKIIVSTKSQQRVLEMATFHGRAKVFRDGIWTRVDCSNLVPGDVIEIEASHNELSVDCVLVKGQVVADESSLTGEALPVAKFPIKNIDRVYNREESEKTNTLIAGCHILEARPDVEGESVMAIILATGASTSKGSLVKDILYPMPISFIFLEHLKIVIPMLAIWGVVMLFLSMAMLGSATADAWFYGMITISQILSPLLPAVLVIGQSIAADRLRAQGIMCVDLARITLAGKVKVFCFDKTGTLTKEGLDFLGTHAIDKDKAEFKVVKTEFESFDDEMKQAMLCCHSLSMVGSQHVGNFVDIEMFKATAAVLDTRSGSTTMIIPNRISDNINTMHILKRFEFVHSHAYMSVVAMNTVTNRITVYIKGSFEKVQELVNPFTLPANFEAVSKSHSSTGCYVLAIARRELPEGTLAADLHTWTREQFEYGADMVGLLLFRNQLKPDTVTALEELRGGGCRVVMITGDHVNTGIHIAQTSGMICQDWQGVDPIVALGDVDKSQDTVHWTLVGSDKRISRSELENMLGQSRSGLQPVELAVTGKAFNMLVRDGFMNEYLFETRVFARMSPEDKVQCVRLHMTHCITAMCGDGGNDAGALKASHAGVSLSEAKSSVVSHFSSRNRSIHSCVNLLKEARCSLDVSFASYKYLIMYGEILAFVGLIQYYFVVNMSQAMWILIDGITIPISWALTMSKPSRRLVNSRPTARLLGFETIASIVGQIFINIIILVIATALLFKQSFLKCSEFDGNKADMRRWWELADNFEGEVTGLITAFQIIHASAAFNLGSKYRNGFMMNRPFFMVYTVWCLA